MRQLTAETEARTRDAEPVEDDLTLMEIGRLLRDARYEQGLALEGPAAALLMRRDQLHALEEGRLDWHPSLRQATACLRIYADHLGLDGGKLAAALEPNLHETGVLPDPGTTGRSTFRSVSGALAVALALGVVGAGTYGWWPKFAQPITLPEVVRPSAVAFGPKAQASPSAGQAIAADVASHPPKIAADESAASGKLAKAKQVAEKVSAAEPDSILSKAAPASGHLAAEPVPARHLTGLIGADRIALRLLASSPTSSMRWGAPLNQPGLVIIHEPAALAPASPEELVRALEPVVADGIALRPREAAATATLISPAGPGLSNDAASPPREVPHSSVSNGVHTVVDDAPFIGIDDPFGAGSRPPVAPPTSTQQPRVKPASVMAGQKPGRYAVQLAAVRDQSDAIAAFPKFAKRYASLAGLSPRVPERVDIPGRGIFHRVRAGAFVSHAEAQALCDKLRAEGAECLVVRP